MSLIGKQQLPSLIYKIFHLSKQAMVVTTKTAQIVEGNQAFFKLLNNRSKQKLDLNQFLDITTHQPIWENTTTVRPWDGKVVFQQDGTTSTFRLHVEQMDEIGEEPYFLLSMSNEERCAEKEEELHFLAYHDRLTKLPNRLLFEEKTNHWIQMLQASSQTGAMLFIDLDRFKLINDTFGHTSGDYLLKEAAQRLRNCIGDQGIIARIGGDELACFLPYLDHQAVVDRVKTILKAFSAPFFLRETEVQVTTSIGISFFPHDGDNFELLLANADMAMYRAKKKGRNNYAIFDVDFQTSNLERLHVETMLRHAIKKGQLKLYYQPQVNVVTKQIDAVEALIRWDHPDYGEIAPSEFIPIAEEIGFISVIDDWVMKTACHQNVRWQTTGYKPIRMSINISAQQFMQRDFSDKVQNILNKSKLDPHLLEIEITETIIMQDTELTASQLKKIKEMGVNIAIDNFGIGHSSFHYMKNFPVDCLKMDRTFIADMDSDTKSKAIMKSMVTLGRDLQLRVVAEGVETRKQLLHLTEQKCDEVQGSYFYKPLPENTIAKLLKNNEIVD